MEYSVCTARNFFVYKDQRNGADEIRTHDLLHAMQALSQLSYGPAKAISFQPEPPSGR